MSEAVTAEREALIRRSKHVGSEAWMVNDLLALLDATRRELDALRAAPTEAAPAVPEVVRETLEWREIERGRRFVVNVGSSTLELVGNGRGEWASQLYRAHSANFTADAPDTAKREAEARLRAWCAELVGALGASEEQP